MKTFNQYIEYSKCRPYIAEAANLMVELDADPNKTIHNWLESKLEEGFFKNLGRGIWRGGKQVAGGIAAGAGQAHDAMAGPQAKYDAAENSLQKLVDSMMKNPQLLKMPGKHPDGTLSSQLKGLVTQLQQQKDMVPKLMAQTAQNNYQQTGQPNQAGKSYNMGINNDTYPSDQQEAI